MGGDFVCKLVLFLLLGSAAARARAVAFEQTKFIIGAYSEPPYSSLMDASYAQMAAAGFNMVWKIAFLFTYNFSDTYVPPSQVIGGFSCNTTDTIAAQLEVAGSFGIEAIVGAYNAFNPEAPWPCNSSACLGFHVLDEPGSSQFDWVAKAVAAAHAAAPGKLAFVNLLPLGAVENYTDYLMQFIAAVAPDVLSFDNYPNFTPDGAESSKQYYMANLDAFRVASLQHQLPFWNYLVRVFIFLHRILLSLF